jgi:RNA ligase (TIGR02306 family)
MSEFCVEVVPVDVQPHPNADRLGIVKVRGYSVCVPTNLFVGVQLGAYIPPDSLVDPNRSEFAFLKDKEKDKYGGMVRIKVEKLRGVVSMGLLLPAKEGWEVGDDVATELGVEHFDPPLPMDAGGEDEAPPPGYLPKYDVEALLRYPELFEKGEEVIVTEKIHGCNARYCFIDDRMWAGSRANWKKYNPNNLWWRALAGSTEINEFCQAHPECTIYSEVYGNVQDLKYHCTIRPLPPRIGVFDILRGSEWLSYDDAKALGPDLPWVPEIYRGPYDQEKIAALAEGPSLVDGADHIREGVVVKPIRERTSLEVGRVFLKVVGNGYLERAK